MNFIEMKQQAKGMLNQGQMKQKPFVVGLIYIVVGIVFSMLTERLFLKNFGNTELTSYLNYYMNGDFERCIAILERCAPSSSAYYISALIAATGAILYAGLIVFFINTVRQKDPCAENLLDGFGFFWKVLLLRILQSLLVSLWSLLLVFPGVIAFYQYRQAIYVLCENPEKNVIQCLKESRKMMKGHKWELFCLDLSFLGWMILQAFPWIGYAVRFYVVPYMGITRTVYYVRLKWAYENNTATAV